MKDITEQDIDIPPHTSKVEYIHQLEVETFDLIAKITSVLKDHNLWGDDGTFTFRDGDRWSRFEPELEEEYLSHVKEETVDYG